MATSTSPSRRARVRLRTLIRWLWYFETCPIRSNEILLRAVPNAPGYIKPSMGKWAVNPSVFEPHKKRDVDGMSFFREDFITPQELAKSNTNADGVHIVQISASQLRELGLSAEPSPIPEQLPGHVIVPGMRYIDKKQLSQDEKNRVKDAAQRLSQWASQSVVYSPPSATLQK